MKSKVLQMNRKINYSLLVAIIALSLTLWQARTQIRHNHISVEPRITSYFSNDGLAGKWGIYIVNNGMGTAFVKKLSVLVDGQEVPEHEWGKFYSALLALKLDPMCFLIGGPRRNDSFKVGEEIFLLKARPLDLAGTPEHCSFDHTRLLFDQKEKLDYRLTIESIYGDEFEYRYAENRQTAL